MVLFVEFWHGHVVGGCDDWGNNLDVAFGRHALEALLSSHATPRHLTVRGCLRMSRIAVYTRATSVIWALILKRSRPAQYK